MKDPIKTTIENVDASVDKYIIGKEDPEIVINHLIKFNSLIKQNSLILDLGCGHGRDCKYFEDKDHSVIGVDLSKNMLDLSRSICKKSLFIELDIRDVSKIPIKFDGIWSCATIHHLPREYIKDLIKGICDLLNDNGILFISIKLGDKSGFVYREDLQSERYYEFYKEEELVELLKDNGLSILETSIENKEYTWLNIYGVKNA